MTGYKHALLALYSNEGRCGSYTLTPRLYVYTQTMSFGNSRILPMPWEIKNWVKAFIFKSFAESNFNTISQNGRPTLDRFEQIAFSFVYTISVVHLREVNALTIRKTIWPPEIFVLRWTYIGSFLRNFA